MSHLQGSALKDVSADKDLILGSSMLIASPLLLGYLAMHFQLFNEMALVLAGLSFVLFALPLAWSYLLVKRVVLTQVCTGFLWARLAVASFFILTLLKVIVFSDVPVNAWDSVDFWVGVASDIAAGKLDEFPDSHRHSSGLVGLHYLYISLGKYLNFDVSVLIHLSALFPIVASATALAAACSSDLGRLVSMAIVGFFFSSPLIENHILRIGYSELWLGASCVVTSVCLSVCARRGWDTRSLASVVSSLFAGAVTKAAMWLFTLPIAFAFLATHFFWYIREREQQRRVVALIGSIATVLVVLAFRVTPQPRKLPPCLAAKKHA